MYLIVGIGNPGKTYEKTRHNIGFMMLDYFFKENNITSFNNKFNGVLSKNNNIIYLKPLSFVNLSGEVVREVVNYYKIPVENILIILDDINLPLAKIRLREKGSSGGHNGLQNIINNLGTSNIKRLRIGVGSRNQIEMKDFVLGKFKDEEIKRINGIKPVVSDIINEFTKHSFTDLMTKYNKKDE